MILHYTYVLYIANTGAGVYNRLQTISPKTYILYPAGSIVTDSLIVIQLRQHRSKLRELRQNNEGKVY